MARQHIYTVYTGNDRAWSVVKMDRDWDVIETYHVSKAAWPQNMCTCFAGTKDTCRHRQMIEVFLEANAINSRRAYDFDKARWIDPPKAALEMMNG